MAELGRAILRIDPVLDGEHYDRLINDVADRILDKLIKGKRVDDLARALDAASKRRGKSRGAN